MIYALAILIALLQIADYWLTVKVLEHGGTELNPVMRFLFKGLGTETGLLVGKVYVVAFVLVGADLGWFDTALGFLLLVGLALLYLVVVASNFIQYKRN